MKQLIKQAIEAGIFTLLDYYFAEAIVNIEADAELDDTQTKYDEALFLVACLVSRAYAYGHIVLPLSYLYSPYEWFHEENYEQREQHIQKLLAQANIRAENSEDWAPILARISAPLTMTELGIYLDKNYQYETEVVHFIQHHAKTYSFNDDEMAYLREKLTHYFPEVTGNINEYNWQKVAAANSLLQQVSIISGGPGTGKTTTVFNILVTFLEYCRDMQKWAPKIVLSAPTGKAAARLTESINGQKARMRGQIDDEILDVIPSESRTLHRLLGIPPIQKIPRYNHDHPLTLDLLIVDEASMIDLQMFAQVIDALPANARLILLGDKDQLSSVEAGSVMYELCQQEKYSPKNQQQLTLLTGYELADTLSQSDCTKGNNIGEENSPYFDYLSILKKSYRFSETSSLGQLAFLINATTEQGKFSTCLQIFNEATDGTTSLVYLPTEKSVIQKQLEIAFADYSKILQDHTATPETIFKTFNQVRVLCTQKSGNYGTEALNALIAQTLFPEAEQHYFYHGLSIMIEQNDYEYGLFNGDIGLILFSGPHLRAYFEIDNEIVSFSIHSLPKYEIAFAMTVHKSQGSEFDHVLLFLAEYRSAFLTQELFYTGVTRAKQKVTVFSAPDALQVALSQKTNRFSFIYQRLRTAQGITQEYRYD